MKWSAYDKRAFALTSQAFQSLVGVDLTVCRDLSRREGGKVKTPHGRRQRETLPSFSSVKDGIGLQMAWKIASWFSVAAVPGPAFREQLVRHEWPLPRLHFLPLQFCPWISSVRFTVAPFSYLSPYHWPSYQWSPWLHPDWNLSGELGKA